MSAWVVHARFDLRLYPVRAPSFLTRDKNEMNNRYNAEDLERRDKY